MIDQALFQEQVREALNHLYDYERLQELELAEWLQARPDGAGIHPLNRVLIRAIEQLKPAPHVPADTPDWRAYHILFYRFVQCVTVQEVASQFGLGERHFRRQQAQAIALLADILWNQYVVGESTSVGKQEAHLPGQSSGANGAKQDDVDANLAWLKREPVLQQGNLNAVMAGVESVLAYLAREKGTTLSISLPPDLPRVRMHPQAIRQVLMNLLAHVIEAAPASQITIRAWHQERTIYLTVAPHTPVAATETPFTQTDPLAITHQLLDMYEGRLDRTLGSDNLPVFTLAVPAARRMPVLIVEDNADTAALFARFLADSAYRPVIAPNGIEALTLLEDVRPGAIVLDVMMPGQDGWETLILLKAHPLAEQVPILVSTILTDRELALSLGAADFLHKPVSQDQLLAALDRAVSAQYRYRYALLPHGVYSAAWNNRRAQEAQTPLLALRMNRWPSSRRAKPYSQLPVAGSFYTLDAPSGIISTAYLEQGHLFIRLCEDAGENHTAQVRMLWPVQTAQVVDLAGNLLETLTTQGNAFTVSLGPYKIITLRLVLDPYESDQ